MTDRAADWIARNGRLHMLRPRVLLLNLKRHLATLCARQVNCEALIGAYHRKFSKPTNSAATVNLA